MPSKEPKPRTVIDIPVLGETAELAVDPRERLTGEKAKKFSNLVAGKVDRLSTQPTHTLTQVKFIDAVVEHSSRLLLATTERGLRLPESSDAEAMRTRLQLLAGILGGSTPNPKSLDTAGGPEEQVRLKRQDLTHAVEPMIGATVGISQTPEGRSPITEYAALATRYFGEVVDHNGGIDADKRISESVYSTLTQFEAVANQVPRVGEEVIRHAIEA